MTPGASSNRNSCSSKTLKLQAELVTNLFFRNHWRTRIVWLTRVTGQDQAAATRSQLSRHRWSILFQCVSTNRIVTTAIEKELKGRTEAFSRRFDLDLLLRLW